MAIAVLEKQPLAFMIRIVTHQAPWIRIMQTETHEKITRANLLEGNQIVSDSVNSKTVAIPTYGYRLMVQAENP